MKSLSKELQDRAIQAMAAAIEIYNKPGMPYRSESFAILAINAWELLLKAKWLDLHSHKKNSLYVYERRQTKAGCRGRQRYIKRTRSRTPFTHEAGYLAKQLVNGGKLDKSATQNIELMLEFRDCATHFYNENPVFNARLYQIGAACVKNFVTAAQEWFERDVSEFGLHLMPLTMTDIPSDVKPVMLNTEERSLLTGCVRSLGHVLEWRYETQTIPQRPDRRTVGCSGFPTPISQDRGKATYCKPTGGRQRHCVRSAQRLHVASHAA